MAKPLYNRPKVLDWGGLMTWWYKAPSAGLYWCFHKNLDYNDLSKTCPNTSKISTWQLVGQWPSFAPTG